MDCTGEKVLEVYMQAYSRNSLLTRNLSILSEKSEPLENCLGLLLSPVAMFLRDCVSSVYHP